ncbi:MAG TPA: hypothetical protein VFX28_07160, partial [Methylomirabilota bacterium]|nr:hypothetical protein [Methylomirabilota bacterium]
MIDLIVDGRVTSGVAGGGGGLGTGVVGGRDVTALPDRFSEIRQRLEEALASSALLGAPSERPIPLDVSIRLLLFVPSGQAFGSTAFAAVDSANRFSATLRVDETRLDEGFNFALRVEGVVPDGFSGVGGAGGELTPADIPAGTPGATPGAQLVALLQDRSRDLEVPVSTTALALAAITVAPPPDETGRAFRDIGSALVEFFTANGTQVGVGVLRGDDDTRTASVFFHPGARAGDLWFRVRRGTDVRVDAPSSVATLARSVLTTPGLFAGRIAMLRIVESVGVGTLSNEIAEAAVVGFGLVYKDLDIDLTGAGRLRVRCKVGTGFELDGAVVMAMQLGEFTGQYELGIDQDNTAPFQFGQLASVVTVAGVSSTYDWLPFTDLDDLGGQGFVESVVAAFISDNVVARVRRRIGDRVQERAEEALEPVRDSLADFPLTAAEVEASVFVQLNRLDVSVDEIELVARGGVWHPVLELLGAQLECAVTQTAMMTRRRAVVPVARIVQKRLARKELRPWAEAYARHKA